MASSEGQPFTAVVSTFTDSDPQGTVSDYIAVIDWGDGNGAATAGVITYDGSQNSPPST